MTGQGTLFAVTAPVAAESDATVVLRLQVILKTDKAFKVTDGRVRVMIPFTLINACGDDIRAADIDCPHPVQDIPMPRWLARERGLM